MKPNVAISVIQATIGPEKSATMRHATAATSGATTRRCSYSARTRPSVQGSSRTHHRFASCGRAPVMRGTRSLA